MTKIWNQGTKEQFNVIKRFKEIFINQEKEKINEIC